MDNHKLVTISIFFFLKHEKDAFFLFFFFMKICLENFLGFSRMHENKIFLFLFCFLKRKINLKILNFFRNISEKTQYLNTRFVSYSVKVQPNIKQNW
jgi:hypothetical protein